MKHTKPSSNPLVIQQKAKLKEDLKQWAKARDVRIREFLTELNRQKLEVFGGQVREIQKMDPAFKSPALMW